MRIIAGTHRGRVIRSLKGHKIRPTSDRVRESFFNIIGQYFNSVTVLDIYSGTGAIGLEFLSRGAYKAVFVDNSKESIGIAKKNAEDLNLIDRCQFFVMEASEFITKVTGERFDYIYIDPPYNINVANTVLCKIDESILKENGIITVEHSIKMRYPDRINRLYRYKERRFGDTVLSFYSMDATRYEERIL